MSSTKYKGGRINRIRLKNFMTYDYLQLYPAPGLNLLLGPNGAGKSTIMCALCLGLTGTPKYTGRSTMRLVDFLKNKEESSFIELNLDDQSGKDIIIGREIMPNGKSRYILNKEVVDQVAVENIISQFNIQVDNMCQFLPQEKVSDFARMNAKQLLETMQQAVGNKNMHENYTKLIELQAQVDSVKQSLGKNESILNCERRKNDNLSIEVEKFEKREKYIQEMKILERQRHVLIYFTKKNEYDEEKKKCKKLYKDLANLKSSHEPLENEILCFEKHVKEIETEVIQLEQKISNSSILVEKQTLALKQYDHKIREVKHNVQVKLTEIEQQRQRQNDLEKQLAGYDQKRLSCIKSREELEPKVLHDRVELKKCKEKRWNLHSEINQCRKVQKDTQVEIASIDDQINVMKDCDQKKLQYLHLNFPDTYKATLWLRDNHNLFSKQIYDPLLMLISVEDVNNVKYLENHISGRDFLVFLCEDKEDAKKFTNLLRVQNNLAVNAAPVPKKPLALFRPDVPVDLLRRKYHFHYYLKDAFSAPDAVIAFLCDIYQIHNIPIGDAKTDSLISSMINSLPFFRFYAADNSYVCKKSLYGQQHTSVSTYQIRGKEILGFVPNQKDLLNLERRKHKLVLNLENLKEEESQLCQQEHEVTKLIEQLHLKEKHYSMLGDQITNCERQIQQIKLSISMLKEKTVDIVAEKKNATILVKSSNDEQVIALSNLLDTLKEFTSMEKQKIKKRFSLVCFSHKRKKLHDQLHSHNQIIKDKQDEIAQVENKTQQLKDRARELMEKLNTIFCSESSQQESNSKTLLIEKIKEEIGSLKYHDLSTFENEINKLQANINCICETDPALIQDHRNRQKLIQEKEESITNLRTKLSDCHTKIKELKVLWLTPLESIVSQISAKFSDYFEKLNCAGEVTITSGSNTNDFDKYGLALMVKFRDNVPLRQLSQTYHSGGECSVATIIFILSLQELTEVPFRCVDEINQGMDSVNERRVFDLISSSAANSSQYFLLTPKLLPDLKYSKQMKVHIINSGIEVEKTALKWNMRKIIQSVEKVNG